MGNGMRGWGARAVALGLLAAAPWMLAACADDGNGDDALTQALADEDDEEGSFPFGSEDEDGESAGDETSQQAPGSDEEYVRELCMAMDRFFGDFEDATRSITPDDPSGIAEDFSQAIGGPLGQLAEDMRNANPPADVADWHADAVDQMKELAEDIQAGDELHTIAGIADGPLPNPPEGLDERLVDAAESVPECGRYVDLFAG